MRKLNFIIVFICIFFTLITNSYASDNYFEEVSKSYEIGLKIKNGENVTIEEQKLFNKINKVQEEELRILEEADKYRLENDPEFLKEIEEHRKKYTISSEELDKQIKEIEGNKELQQELLERNEKIYEEEKINKILDIKENTNNVLGLEDGFFNIEKNFNKIITNRDKAVEYALKWTSNEEELRNSNYPSFNNDCTNFISQVLEAGKIPQITSYKNGDRFDSRNWYFYWGRFWGHSRSNSWSVAEELKNHFIKNSKYTEVTKFKELKVGDIIFFDWGGINGTKIDHVMVVTKIESYDYNGLKLSGHTNERQNISFGDFMKAARGMENVRYVDYQLWSVKY